MNEHVWGNYFAAWENSKNVKEMIPTVLSWLSIAIASDRKVTAVALLQYLDGKKMIAL